MFCPLRKRVNSASFEECYKEKCEWWIFSDDEDEKIGGCAIKYMGLLAVIYISGSSKEEEQ